MNQNLQRSFQSNQNSSTPTKPSQPKVHFHESTTNGKNNEAHKQISSLLPKQVINSLIQKEKLLEMFNNRCTSSKKKIEQDIDTALKGIILLFEDFKQQLFVKIDDHSISFANLFGQFESLCNEASDWAEKRIAEFDNYKSVKVNVDDNLYNHLNEARMRKQKADEMEQAFLAVKQKIEQLKLNELNNDIIFLADEKNPEIYIQSEAGEFNEKLRDDLKEKLNRVDQNRLIRPFILDQKSITGLDIKSQVFTPVPVVSNANSILVHPDVRASQNYKVYESQRVPQINEVSIHKRSDAESLAFATPNYKVNASMPTPNYKLNASNLEVSQAERISANKQSLVQKHEGPIIAHQNQFLSDELDLSYPIIRQEKDIALKTDFKTNCLISLSPKLLMVGAEDGTLVLMDITLDPPAISQLLVKAHNSPVKGLTKANDVLVLSSAEKPDTSLKLWDISTVTDFAQNAIDTSRMGSVLLVSVLKGLNETPIGHGFLNERVVIGVSRGGELCVWDWKLATPLCQLNLKHQNITSFLLFTDKESFAISTSNGLIVAYAIIKSSNGYDFVKQSEIQEAQPVTYMHSFRGNNDIIIVTLNSGEVKLLSKKAKINYHTIGGCKNPLGFLVLTWVKADPNIYLMALENYGFKIADIDGKDFAYVNTESRSNYRFEGNGWPLCQIVDVIPGQRVIMATLNNAVKPNSIILWSIAPGKY